MALGGGTFTNTDKTLPGAYINTISASRTMNLVGDNGIVAIAIESDFGNQGEILKIKPSDFREDSLNLLGYNLFDEKLKGLRELFENSKLVYLYILNKTTKAENEYAIAKKGGIRGNDIIIKVQNNVDDPSKKDVITMLDYIVIDRQTVRTASELQDNSLVEFKKSSELEITIGTSLASGNNGGVTNAEHQDFLNKIETLHFNVLACMATTKELQKLYINFTKRLRDYIGLKFQTVMCEAHDWRESDFDSNMYDYEGVIVTVNKVRGSNVKGNELIPFTAGISASADLGKSNLNKTYTGEYEIIADYTQSKLKELIKKGRFVYHVVGDELKVLEDINGLMTTTKTKQSEFKDNQVVRVLDALAMADAKVFNDDYLGKVNIDTAGIESYTNRLIDVRNAFVSKGALKEYDSNSIVVKKIESEDVRGAVTVESVVTPAECFRQLYLTNYVK